MISPREERSLLEVGLASFAEFGNELRVRGRDVLGFGRNDSVVVEFGVDWGRFGVTVVTVPSVAQLFFNTAFDFFDEGAEEGFTTDC